MANRTIRDGFCDSHRVNSLSPIAECAYTRMIIKVDDAGRIDGRPEMLLSVLYPIKKRMKTSTIRRCVTEMIAVGLIQGYTWDGKPYLQLSFVQRYGNATTSRCPWVDGSFEITYTWLPTRDGKRQFITTSLPKLPIEEKKEPASIPHSDGIGMSSSSNLETSHDMYSLNDNDNDNVKRGSSTPSLSPFGKPPEKEKKLFGKGVYLEREEETEFKNKYGDTFFNACIQKLDDYMANMRRKKPYKDHAAVIRSWVIDAVKKTGLIPYPRARASPAPPAPVNMVEDGGEDALAEYHEQTEKLTKKIKMGAA